MRPKNMAGRGKICIEVAYATHASQRLITVDVSPTTPVEQVIRASGLLEKFPEIDLEVNQVGIFGEMVDLNTLVQPGDRVEIYRPLRADLKEARRGRAARKD